MIDTKYHEVYNIVSGKAATTSLSSLNSGDLLFFKSYGSFPGNIVELSCFSPWCHIAIVIKMNKHLIVNNVVVAFKGRKYVWESAVGCDIPSVIPISSSSSSSSSSTRYKNSGAILTPLKQRLENCGTIGVQKLRYQGKIHEERRRREMIDERMYEHIIQNHAKNYETHYLDFLKVWIHSVLCMEICCVSVDVNVNSSSDSFFCSELIARALIDARIMYERKNKEAEREFWNHQEDRVCCNSPCLCFIDCSTNDVVLPGEFTVADLSNDSMMNAYYLNVSEFKYVPMYKINYN